MADNTSNNYPSVGLTDFLRLVGSLGAGFLRNPLSFNTSVALSEWRQGVSKRRKSDNLILNLGFRKLFLVTGRGLTQHILSHEPSSQTYMEGPGKVNAMTFLAPQALTICHDQQWQRLRAYNDQVLSIGDDPERQQVFLGHVRQAFSGPISSVEDLRSAMNQVMVGVVFGERQVPPHVTEDIQVLFSYVQGLVRRAALGRKEGDRQKRFRDALGQLWQDQGDPQQASLLSAGQKLAAGDGHTPDELLDQIPHWMFTFTGSGTDLLSRTLAMIGARPQVRARVEQEIDAQGPLNQASTITQLEFLEACFLETGRLFPPVVRTSHVAPQGDVVGGETVPAGMEILHYFTAQNRDTEADPSANDFRPERWLEPGSEAASLYPNLFLSGPRACPGRDLILFVCKAAAAMLLKERNLRVTAPSLAANPVPYSFPDRDVRFST